MPPGDPDLPHFGEVRQHFSDPDGRERYVDEALVLFGDNASMGRALALQIHVNARIADRKHQWVHRGLRSLLLGLLALAATAALSVGLGGAPI